jgi:hypothetical protein
MGYFISQHLRRYRQGLIWLRLMSIQKFRLILLFIVLPQPGAMVSRFLPIFLQH